MFKIPKKHQNVINNELNGYAVALMMLNEANDKGDVEGLLVWARALIRHHGELAKYGIKHSAGSDSEVRFAQCLINKA